MDDEIGIADVLQLTGVGKATIYRWMNRHPVLSVTDPTSPLGSPFPKPKRKQGREVLWDRAQVENWWGANAESVGRHPGESATIVMPWASFRKAMLTKPRRFKEDDGTERVEDDFDKIKEFSRLLDDVRVRFETVDDAVLFRMKY